MRLVRVLAGIALVSLVAAPALANPRSRQETIRSRVDSLPRTAPAPAPARSADAPAVRSPSPARSLPPASASSADAESFAMPLLWTAVRAKLAAQLPSPSRVRGVTYSVMPMTITSPSEATVPALGIAGTF